MSCLGQKSRELAALAVHRARLDQEESGGWVALSHPSARTPCPVDPQRPCVRDCLNGDVRGRREHGVHLRLGGTIPSCTVRRRLRVTGARRTTSELLGTDCYVRERNVALVQISLSPVVACAVTAVTTSPLVLLMVFCPVMCA
ncbi:unnamed protein product, partial [Ectocarpus sp. 12 AP-2014]